MHTLSSLQKYFQENKESLLKKYATFLSFKTISSLSESKNELEDCSLWLKEYIESMGGTVELFIGKGAPIVYAHFPSPYKNAKTVLIYNHYDVQPVDPIEEWETDPFIATFKDDLAFARGAQDNKGQCFFVLAALEALMKEGSPLPCSVKLIIEGEEENGSTLLFAIAQEKAQKLKADYTMIIDVGMRESGPAITLGTRGLTSLTVTVSGPKHDLHSGLHGGIAHNPLHAISSILASLRNEDGSISIPGFYDDIVFLSDQEKEKLSLTMDEKAWEHECGQEPTGGELSLPPIERAWLRPTIEINGIHGGYGGEGSKTVIPKEAIAKLSCRLVPNQDPKKIAALVKSFILQKNPRGIRTQVHIHEGMGRAVRTRLSSEALDLLSHAMEQVFGKKPEYILDGASIPISPLLEEVSHGELIMWGVGLPSDRIHSPNERFSLDRMEKGFLTLCLTLLDFHRLIK